MRADAHTGAGAITVVWRAAIFERRWVGGGGEVAIRVERARGVKVGGVIIRSICILGHVQTLGKIHIGKRGYHVESCAGWDGGLLPYNVLDTDSGQANGNDGPVTEGFFDEGRDKGNLFLIEAFFPSIAIGVGFHDFLIRSFLNLLTVWGRKIANAHDNVSGDSVEPCGNHC